MPRKPRFCPADYPIHVIQRGHNRQICFTSNADIAAYASWLNEGALKCNVAIHGWVFMTNHVHLLLRPGDDKAVSKLMQFLGRLYVRYFNQAYSRSGCLFDDRFKSCLIQDDLYFLKCLRYIELNPIRAGMVKDPAEYRWSSYAAHGLGKRIAMLTPHPLYLKLGNSAIERAGSYRKIVSDSLGAGVVSEIRHCVNKGIILGSESFKHQFKVLTGDETKQKKVD